MGQDNAALFGERGAPIADKIQAATDAVCDGNPLARKVRKMLHQMERGAHKHGFDHPQFTFPRVFMASREPAGTAVQYRWMEDETNLVCGAMGRYDIGGGQALGLLANALEEVRADLTEEVVATARERGMDFIPGFPAGWEFFGFGLCAEGWMMPPGKMTEPGTPEWREMLEVGISGHPARQSVRQIVFAARDGLIWQVFRREGFDPVCWVELPEAEAVIGGGLSGALRRMVNAVVLTPSPVPDVIVATPDAVERRPYRG